MKPSFTLTYGLGWALEMPPVEEAGKQAVLVDQANQPISTTVCYLAPAPGRPPWQARYSIPSWVLTTVGNTANGLKYPYNPYYGEFQPACCGSLES